jgi:hypothetical protein
MLPNVIYLYPSNTQVVQVTELQDQVSGLFLTQATVTATLLDRRGNPDPVLNNLPLNYVNGTDATYQGVVPPTFSARVGGGYVLRIIAIQAGVQAEFSIPVIVQPRKK